MADLLVFDSALKWVDTPVVIAGGNITGKSFLTI